MRKQFRYTWHIYVTKAIYALLAHFCRENDLRASSGKFLRVKLCRPESLDFLCLWTLDLASKKTGLVSATDIPNKKITPNLNNKNNDQI